MTNLTDVTMSKELTLIFKKQRPVLTLHTRAVVNCRHFYSVIIKMRNWIMDGSLGKKNPVYLETNPETSHFPDRVSPLYLGTVL